MHLVFVVGLSIKHHYGRLQHPLFLFYQESQSIFYGIKKALKNPTVTPPVRHPKRNEGSHVGEIEPDLVEPSLCSEWR